MHSFRTKVKFRMFLFKRANVSDVFFSSTGFNRERTIKLIQFLVLFHFCITYNFRSVCASFSNEDCVELEVGSLNFSIWLYNQRSNLYFRFQFFKAIFCFNEKGYIVRVCFTIRFLNNQFIHNIVHSFGIIYVIGKLLFYFGQNRCDSLIHICICTFYS